MAGDIKVLFMDDSSKRIMQVIKNWKGCNYTIVTNVKDCLRKLSQEEWDEVWLDHDLGGVDFVDPDSSECGMEVVRYIEKTEWPVMKKKPIFTIHSSNGFATAKMGRRLKDMGFVVVLKQFQYDH